jgi:RimJ/RimL family protein N-acetyltransferase
MIKPKVLEKGEIYELTDLLNNYFFKPYFNCVKLNREVLADYFFYEIQNAIRINENYIVGLQENGKYIAFCVLKKSETESEILEKQIFSLSHIVSLGSYTTALKNKLKLLDFLNSNFSVCIDMLSCRANANDISTIHALEKQLFIYMDGLVTYSFEMPQRKSRTISPFFTIRLSKKEDLDQIKKIAYTSFSIDRFHNDPHIPKKQSNKIYVKFIENATQGIGADRILVAEYDNEIIGFNSIEIKNRLLAQFGIRIGSFPLNAVSSDYRNRGVYSGLVNDSLIYLNERTDIVEIRAHINNYPVHRALSKLGFKLTLSQITFHHWNTGDNRKYTQTR